MDQGRRHVLVVSTDLDILRALSHALTLSGHAVIPATDCSEATGKLRPGALSVMVYDLKELDRCEWDMLVELRTAHPDLPVVLLSSVESPELDRALTEGLIAGYQVKPIRLSTLEDCLVRVGAIAQRACA